MEEIDATYKPGGTRLDEMLPQESLDRLIQSLTPDYGAIRLARQRRFLNTIPTNMLEAEIERRKDAENGGE